MATIYRRGKADGSFTYWTRFRRDGREIRVNTGTDNKLKAEAFLRKQQGAIDEGLDPQVDPRRVAYQRLRDNLIEHYKVTGKREEREYQKRLAHLNEFFSNHRAAAVTEPEITKYVAFRQGQLVHRAGGQATPPSGATINRELAVLKKMLALGHRARLLVHVPHVEMLVESEPRAGFVNGDVFEKIRKNLDADLQAAAVIGVTYGCRLQEILGLTWDEIDFEAREIRLRADRTKTRKTRTLPFTDEVEVLLQEQRARVAAHVESFPNRRIPSYVFPLLPGNHVPADKIGTRRQSVRRAWALATKAAGVPGVLFHDLRRSAVRNLVRAGVSPTVAQTISGHRSANVFARYNITSADDRRDAMKRLREFQLGGGQ